MSRAKCRYPDCTGRHHGRGLCNKHRKWIERGYMSEDLVMLKPLTRVGSYRGVRCSIPDCKGQARRNGLCNNCSCKVRAGTLLSDGTAVRKRVLKYSKDMKCVICGNGGKIVKGMCRTHYHEYSKGYIDFDGVATGKLRLRVASYKGVKCRVGSCYVQARSRGFCTNHFANFQAGYYNFAGKALWRLPFRNKGKKCKVCDSEARTIGYCPKHYSRKRKGLPLLDEDFYVNKGRPCAVERCAKPAKIKGFCEMHYYRLQNGLAMNNGPAIPRKICHCGVPALAKGLCSIHYERKRRENIIQIRGANVGEAQTGPGVPAAEGGVQEVRPAIPVQGAGPT